jgi:hypothetical protein
MRPTELNIVAPHILGLLNFCCPSYYFYCMFLKNPIKMVVYILEFFYVENLKNKIYE